jgi:hypothetical protein
MARGVFTIVELFRVGGQTAPEEGERFEWTSDPTPIDQVNGGARAAPLQPWSFGIALRSTRTDYSGAKRPSVQVHGPVFPPFTIRGNFRDKYNFAGYAKTEQRRIEDLVKRGNICRVSFQEQSFECLPTAADWDYRRDYDIGYTITFDNHGRAADTDFRDRSPTTVLSASDLAQDAEQVGDALTAEQTGSPPRSVFKTDAAKDAAEDYGEVIAALDRALDTIAQRDVEPDLKPVDAFRRAATQFRTVRNTAIAGVLTLAPVRSDLDLVTESAIRVLEFEDWSRAMRFYYRSLILSSDRSAKLLDERAEPSAFRLHRASEGESLYSISNRYYGTPHAWRLIASRNNLSDTILTGEELLIIPERGGG